MYLYTLCLPKVNFSLREKKIKNTHKTTQKSGTHIFTACFALAKMVRPRGVLNCTLPKIFDNIMIYTLSLKLVSVLFYDILII